MKDGGATGTDGIKMEILKKGLDIIFGKHRTFFF